MTDAQTLAESSAAHGRPAPRLKALYNDQIRDQLKADLELDNVMQVPRMSKIVVNIGVGEALLNSKHLESAMNDLTVIAGQKPIPTKAKKSLASFKLRQGNAIGCKVTLRGDQMWEFFDRLITLAIPRIRDFRGLNPRSFDGNGNYTFGLTEQLVFPEIDYDTVDTSRGMDITIVTTAQTDAEGRALLDAFSFRSGVKGRPSNGKKGTAQQAAEDAEVQGAGLHPLRELRPAKGRLSPVQSLSCLPADHGAPRGDPRCDQGQLVSGR